MAARSFAGEHVDTACLLHETYWPPDAQPCLIWPHLGTTEPCFSAVAQIQGIWAANQVSIWGEVVGSANGLWQPIRVRMVFRDVDTVNATVDKLLALTDQPQWVDQVTGPYTTPIGNLSAEFVR